MAESKKPGDPPVDPPPLPVMPDTPEGRRTMLDEMSANHDTLTGDAVNFYDALASKVAEDEDAVHNEIGKDPNVNPPEVVKPEGVEPQEHA